MPKEKVTPISGDIEEDKRQMSRAYGDSPDLVLREIRLAPDPRMRALLVNFDGMVDRKMVSDDIIAIIAARHNTPRWGIVHRAEDVFQDLRSRYLASVGVDEATTFEEIFPRLSSGDTAIFVEGVKKALICSTRGPTHRSVDEPATEAVIRGPRDGFIENLRVNTALIRRRINDSRLWIKEISIGKITKTKVAVVYIKDLAPEGLVSEVMRRLERIDIDGVLESGYLEEFIEDAPFSPFPQVLRTERPDRVVGNLLEGRVAIMTDGTPFALIVPATFTQFLMTSEDYYERFFIGTFIRLLRFTAFFISFILPSLYIAVTTFHQELLPTPLVIRVAAQREGVPFPALFEAVLMEAAFEVLREAGVRLPRIIGSAISIVGVLVIGQTAVSAGLVSPFMVIVVSFTAIASFANPVFSLAITARLMRFGLVFMAATAGLFGITFGLSLLLIHLTSLRSFGYPYLCPLAPVVASDIKDSFVRVPWWAMTTRPHLNAKRDPRRQTAGQKPKPPAK